MKKIIIIGASTGIGAELAKVYSEKGWEVGLTARREDLLKELQQSLPGKSYSKTMDVADTLDSLKKLDALIEEMGGMDVIVLNAGIGDSKPDPLQELNIIRVNVLGFTALARHAFEHFSQKGGGHLVGVSSIAGLRGTYMATTYAATKAFVSNSLEGLRQRSYKKKLKIHVTDIRPGFVATPMTEKNKGMFWVSSARKAAEQMYAAIERKAHVAYITRRWRIVAWIFKRIPDFIYNR